MLKLVILLASKMTFKDIKINNAFSGWLRIVLTNSDRGETISLIWFIIMVYYTNVTSCSVREQHLVLFVSKNIA